jgi:hypothetical protein
MCDEHPPAPEDQRRLGRSLRPTSKATGSSMYGISKRWLPLGDCRRASRLSPGTCSIGSGRSGCNAPREGPGTPVYGPTRCWCPRQPHAGLRPTRQSTMPGAIPRDRRNGTCRPRWPHHVAMARKLVALLRPLPTRKPRAEMTADEQREHSAAEYERIIAALNDAGIEAARERRDSAVPRTAERTAWRPSARRPLQQSSVSRVRASVRHALGVRRIGAGPQQGVCGRRWVHNCMAPEALRSQA